MVNISLLTKYGMTGKSVLEIQNMLLALRYKLPKYGADGKFGSETYAAVKAFQRNQGIKVDGIVGPVTKGNLISALSKTGMLGPRPYIKLAPEEIAAIQYREKHPIGLFDKIYKRITSGPVQSGLNVQDPTISRGGLLGISWTTWGIITAVGISFVIFFGETREEN